MRDAEDCSETTAQAADAAVQALVDTDWLRHTLTLSGPAAIPWHLDLDHEEMRLLALMAGAGPAARGLGRELRAQLAAHQERVLTAAVRSTCTGSCRSRLAC